MNFTIADIMNRYSCRRYKDETITCSLDLVMPDQKSAKHREITGNEE